MALQYTSHFVRTRLLTFDACVAWRTGKVPTSCFNINSSPTPSWRKQSSLRNWGWFFRVIQTLSLFFFFWWLLTFSHFQGVPGEMYQLLFVDLGEFAACEPCRLSRGKCRRMCTEEEKVVGNCKMNFFCCRRKISWSGPSPGFPRGTW